MRISKKKKKMNVITTYCTNRKYTDYLDYKNLSLFFIVFFFSNIKKIH